MVPSPISWRSVGAGEHHVGRAVVAGVGGERVTLGGQVAGHIDAGGGELRCRGVVVDGGDADGQRRGGAGGGARGSGRRHFHVARPGALERVAHGGGGRLADAVGGDQVDGRRHGDVGTEPPDATRRRGHDGEGLVSRREDGLAGNGGGRGGLLSVGTRAVAVIAVVRARHRGGRDQHRQHAGGDDGPRSGHRATLTRFVRGDGR